MSQIRRHVDWREATIGKFNSMPIPLRTLGHGVEPRPKAAVGSEQGARIEVSVRICRIADATNMRGPLTKA